MMRNESALYAAFVAKDARFDGRFFVGISSTGIYCRPVCRAKQAKAHNCNFFQTAAEAEQAGYRPCLLCRPELAPGTSITDATLNLVYRATRMLEEKCGSSQSLEEIAEKLGCTDRHLRRVFAAEYNVSPVRYLQTCRLLLAKNSLTDTNLSVLEIAMAAGFGSLRRFNDLFKKQYTLSPTALRKQIAVDKKNNVKITLVLCYRPPYPWEQMLYFLSQRTIDGVEFVENNSYMRTIHGITAEKRQVSGWVQVSHSPQKHALLVTISEMLFPVLPQVLAKVKHVFDLSCDPNVVYESLESMNGIQSELCVLGTRHPGSFNAFELAVHAVLAHQNTIKTTNTLASRIASEYGKPIQTEIPGLTHLFPFPEDILALDPIEKHFRPLGVVEERARAIYELAKAIVENTIDFDVPSQPEEQIKKLMEIHGIGSWTAKYIAMRAMEWPDAFFETDTELAKNFPSSTSKELLLMSEAWRPWRSYAIMNLWMNDKYQQQLICE